MSSEYENMSEYDLRAALAGANSENQLEIWQKLVNFVWDRREFGNAAAIYQTIYDLSIKINDQKSAASAKYGQGSAFFNNKEFSESKDSYIQSAEICSNEGLQLNLADSLWAAADAALSLEDFDEAIKLAKNSEEIANVENDFSIAGKSAFVQLKSLNLNFQEEEALRAWSRARNYFRNSGDIEEVSRVDDYAISVHWDLGRFEEATEIARDVLLKWSINGDADFIAYSNFRLGNCLQKEGRLEESTSYLNIAKDKYLEIQKVSRVAECDQEIAKNNFDLDRFEESIDGLLRARSIWDGVGNDLQAYRCDAIRAISYHNLERFHDAIKLNQRILDFLENQNDDNSKEMAYLVRARLADNALALEDFQLTLKVLHESPPLDDFVPSTQILIWRTTLKARSLYALGREDEALMCANQALELTDEDMLNWNSGFIFEVRGNVLLHKNRMEAELNLAHAIALHLANGYTSRAKELSKIFIPKIQRSDMDSVMNLEVAETIGESIWQDDSHRGEVQDIKFGFTI